MARFTYKPEHLDFLRSHYPKMTIDELTGAFNSEFNLDKTAGQIKAATKNHSIKCGRKVGCRRLKAFTTEQMQFCVEKYKSLNVNQLTIAFNSKFGTDKTKSQIRAFLKNHGIKSGRTGHFSSDHVPHNKGVKGWQAGGRSIQTQFKKGHTPINHREVGSERINVEGYVEVKVSEPNVWKLKQRVIYEREVGPIGPGKSIRFRDGNKRNFEPSNLFQVSNSESMYLTLNSYMKLPESLRAPVINLSKLQSKINTLRSRD
ncbi:HNH endonuclease signature motif containing protein [Pseudoalteromonas ruthenica]|uniref:HNH endonuclease signature motif containing protein n=1 Tax=Pseudoalteromonas ruthenica TaxID=151081 RepID=UPI00110AFE70|nr:HNH endonuclease signature motif containing protein [Pseudoalteromonas ruthenica]TMP23796.1 HNH endonuclease [Pseudoalteromonas ruthenica]